MGATALLALAAVQATSQIGQGYAQKAEAKFNASLLEGQAGMIQIQKDIENAQYQRLKAKTWSTSMTRVAGAGLQPTGSAAAAMIDAQTQISIDQAIGQFNFEQKKQYTLAEAEAMKRKGKQAVVAGYTNAFSTMLQGVSSYGESKGWFDTDAGAKKAGKA
jgi:hypothetical protein